MRRLLAVILTLVCGAFAQVQPVALATPEHRSCCCCGDDGSCGMPSCPATPVSSPVRCTLGQPAQIAAVEVRRAAPASRRVGEKFFAALVAPAAVPVAATSPARVAPIASVPLFTAHCSLLL